MKLITPSIWETGFLASIAAACSGNYQSAKPWFFPRTVGEPHGKVDSVAMSLFRLLSDTATEHKAMVQALETKEAETPEGRKAKHQHGIEVHDLQVLTEKLSIRCDLVRDLAWAYLGATHESLKTVNIDGLGVTEKGLLVAADAPEAPWPLTQEHPIRQVGLHLVRIIAGDDRLSEIGLTKDTDTLRVDEPGEGHIIGETVAFIEDPRLRRLMSLADAVFDHDLGFPCTMRGIMAKAREHTSLAMRASQLTSKLSWALLVDDDLADLAEKGYRLSIESNWAVTAKRKPRVDSLLSMLAGLGLPFDLDDVKIEVLDLDGSGPHEAADCGNPDCAIHGHRKNGGERPGGRRRVIAHAG